MKKRRRTVFWLVPVALASLLLVFFSVDLEPEFAPAPTGIVVSDEALRIHREAIVVDLHADTLLWPRDLDQRGGGGQLDLPRMRDGGLDVVAFTLPTRFFGVGGLKAFHDLWPPSTWFLPFDRVQYQIEKADALSRVRDVADVETIRRYHGMGALSYFHGLEGAHGLSGDVTRIGELKEAGVLFIGIVHLSDNLYGGSSSGSGQGLTVLGRSLLDAMNREAVLVDLAHASEETFFDALELTRYPPIVSHTGVRAVHDSWRNVTDDQIRAVASQGGVIGVMLAPPALATPSLDEWLRHVEHVITVGGEDAVALGSDFDGYVAPPIDVSGLPQLTELMVQKGWSERRIRKVLGENVLRVLSRLP